MLQLGNYPTFQPINKWKSLLFSGNKTSETTQDQAEKGTAVSFSSEESDDDLLTDNDKCVGNDRLGSNLEDSNIEK